MTMNYYMPHGRNRPWESSTAAIQYQGLKLTIFYACPVGGLYSFLCCPNYFKVALPNEAIYPLNILTINIYNTHVRIHTCSSCSIALLFDPCTMRDTTIYCTRNYMYFVCALRQHGATPLFRVLFLLACTLFAIVYAALAWHLEVLIPSLLANTVTVRVRVISHCSNHLPNILDQPAHSGRLLATLTCPEQILPAPGMRAGVDFEPWIYRYMYMYNVYTLATLILTDWIKIIVRLCWEEYCAEITELYARIIKEITEAFHSRNTKLCQHRYWNLNFGG